ncbi:MAG: hypothetical protein QM743_11510 [Chitinophagaceae bacterium]|uniref:Uncharacterized protein n=1 Tax=Rurimicrobium arvi TaxID=2049916 RepID=A0ABP8MKB6_9BACT
MKKVMLFLAAFAIAGSSFAFDGKCCKGKKEKCSKEKKEGKSCCSHKEKKDEKGTSSTNPPAPSK